jgi:hypothetical protein
MSTRVLIAGALGAIVMYAWLSVAHMSPLGHVGFKQIPNEEAAVAALGAAIGDNKGLYFFPWIEPGSEGAMERYGEMLKTSPSGVLLYSPPGAAGMEPRQLVVEFVENLVAATLAAWLVSMTTLSTFVGRAGFVAGVGFIAAITTNISYWNWWGFPTSYTAAYFAMDFVGYVFAGLVIAWWLGRKPKAKPAGASAG